MEVDDLIKNIHDFILGQYNGSLDGSNTFLAFEPLGLMISPTDFQFNGAFNPTLARQMVSMMVDNVPAINEVFEPDAFNKISDQYAALVGDGDKITGTMLFYDNGLDDKQTAEYLALFGQLKTTAQERFAQTGAESSLLDPMASIATCTVTPGTWYDASSPVWQQKTFQSTTSQTTQTTNTNANTTSHPILEWKLGLNLQNAQTANVVNPAIISHLRLMSTVDAPVAAVVTQPVSADPVANTQAPMRRERAMLSATHENSLVSNNVARSVVAPEITETAAETAQVSPLIINRANYPALRGGVAFTQMVNLNRLIGANSNVVTQPINSSQFTIDFSYSLVRIERDWLYEPLLNKAALWYSLTNKAGDYSTGDNSSANTGLLRCIPKAMIVIKDLNISAQWSDADKQSAAASYGFGCFNISSSPPITTTNNQLTSPGIQVIGWICEVMPKLPLNDDPEMMGASANSNTSTTANSSSTTGSSATADGTGNQSAAADTTATNNTPSTSTPDPNSVPTPGDGAASSVVSADKVGSTVQPTSAN